MRVLVIDDESCVRSFIVEVLTRANHLTVEAACGAAALDEARRLTCDVAFLDMGLPDMAGVQVLGLLHRIQPRMKIVVVSGGVLAYDHPDSLLRAGAEEVLQKPFEMRRIQMLIARMAAGLLASG